jgi:steroid 5-alpha reductase family enzyme
MNAMSSSADVMLASAIAIAVLMFATWVVSVVIKNASIVDIVWGSGFVVVAWVSYAVADGDDTRRLVIALMVTLWGLRLAGYLAKRNIGHGEDYRYRAMRKHWGARFPIVSLVTVFLLQGVLMWVVSIGVQLGQVPATPSFGPIGTMGILVWMVGLAFEAVGDLQLSRFKADPANAGKVMDKGLWSLTRHPNYFGDSLVWWGIAIVAAESGLGAWGFLGAAVMNFLLVRVSGVALLEKSLSKRKEGYADYVARTSAFLPRPPKG